MKFLDFENEIFTIFIKFTLKSNSYSESACNFTSDKLRKKGKNGGKKGIIKKLKLVPLNFNLFLRA